VFHEDRARPVFHGKALYYVERSMAEFVSSRGSLAYVIPPRTDDDYADYAADFDGLVLTGGVDVAPGSYGRTPERLEWSGDAVRDAYELALLRAALAANKPVLAICRGHQVLNVAFGGTLHQDIGTHVTGALVHRDAERYEQNEHEIAIEGGLAAILGTSSGRVNSVHHQAIADLAPGLVVEARSVVDGVIEAVCAPEHAWVRGVQWHPEFRFGDPTLVDQSLLFASFLDAASRGKEKS
jgi:putative glutamine amidotransferase